MRKFYILLRNSNPVGMSANSPTICGCEH